MSQQPFPDPQLSEDPGWWRGPTAVFLGVVAFIAGVLTFADPGRSGSSSSVLPAAILIYVPLIPVSIVVSLMAGSKGGSARALGIVGGILTALPFASFLVAMGFASFGQTEERS